MLVRFPENLTAPAPTDLPLRRVSPVHFPGGSAISRSLGRVVRYTIISVFGIGRLQRSTEENVAMLTVGDRIKHRRLELGLSQDDLAQRAGISKSFLSDLERGKRSIGAETLLDLGRAMGLSLDRLMTGHDSGDPKPEVPIPGALAVLADEEGLSFRQSVSRPLLTQREKDGFVDPCTREVAQRIETLF